MLRVFIGWEPRVAVQFHVLVQSLLEHTSIPLQIIPLSSDFYPLKQPGLTKFTWARFLVPYLCGFEGAAVFLDSDILATADIRALVEEVNGKECAVAVCNTDPAYERAAVMFFNCAHPDNKILTPEFIDTLNPKETKLHLISWTQAIHWLPNRFNYLVGYDAPEWCQGKVPNLIHFTKGSPCWPETNDCDFAQHWHQARASAFIPSTNWATILGHSNHATEGPGGVKPAPRVPDAVREPQRS